MPTDSATAAATDPTTGQVKRSAALMQAYRLREVAFRFALDVAGVTVSEPSEALCARARDFAACVRAWSDTNEQARIANGTPLPGSKRPVAKPSKARKRSAGPLRDVPLSSAVDNAPSTTND